MSLPIITRDLTSQDYGIYGYITAIITSLEAFTYLGLRVNLTNSFYHSSGQFRWLWRQVYGFLIIWNGLFGVMAGVFIYFLLPADVGSNRLVIAVLSALPTILLSSSTQLGLKHYQLNQIPLGVVTPTVIGGVIGVSLNILFISYFKSGYMGWLYSVFISQLLLNIYFTFDVCKRLYLLPIFNFKWRLIKSALKISVPTIPHYYSSYLLNSSDRLVMLFLAIPTANVGLYSFAYIFGNIAESVGVAAGKAINPMMLAHYKSNDFRKPRSIVFTLLTVFILGSFIVSIWLKEIFLVVVKNPDLQEAYHIALIIIMSYNYRPLYYGYVNVLFYFEKTNIIWKISFFAGVLNAVLNLIFIPIYGYIAAAYTTFLCLIILGSAGYKLHSVSKVNQSSFHVLGWVLLILFFTLAAFYLVDSSLVVKGVVSIVTILIALILYRKYSSQLNEL